MSPTGIHEGIGVDYLVIDRLHGQGVTFADPTINVIHVASI